MKGLFVCTSSIILLFVGAFAYVYQKNAVILLAYEINYLEQQRTAVAEKQQKLLCEFYKNTSLVQMNQWAEEKRFRFPTEHNVVQVALRPNTAPSSRIAKRENTLMVAIVERFLGLGSQVEARQDHK